MLRDEREVSQALDMDAFERLGGETVLREIVSALIAKMRSDLMIGFYFRAVDVSRLEELEYQHAAQALGAPVEYRGRALGEAHRAHRISGGHFDRRREILRQILQTRQVPSEVVEVWMNAVEQERGEVVSGECK